MFSIAAQNVWSIVILIASLALLRQVKSSGKGVLSCNSGESLTQQQQTWFVPFTGTYSDGSSFPTDASAQVPAQISNGLSVKFF
jgi:hypothetical protein